MSGIVGQNLGRGSGLVKVTAVDADSVTGASIADDAIDSEHYTNASIDNAHLADNAADTDEIADNAVTLAKMAGGTDGNIISYDASGDPVAIATGTDGQVLTSTGAGSPPAFEAAAGGGISDYHSWHLNANFQGSIDPILNWTSALNYGGAMTVSSGIFTFPSTGFWKIFCQMQLLHTSYDSNSNAIQIETTTNDSTYALATNAATQLIIDGSNFAGNVTTSTLFDVTSTANCKCQFVVVCEVSPTIQGITIGNFTWCEFQKLADT